MEKIIKRLLTPFLLVSLLTTSAQIFTASAAGGDLFMTDGMAYFSSSYLVENNPVMVYATAGNNSANDLLGTIKFIDETTGTQISSDQPISVTAGGEDIVFVYWYPTAGDHTVSITIYPWTDEGDDSSNNRVTKYVYVEPDFDGDGIGDSEDSDDDNDGYSDDQDDFPYDPNEWEDTDGDGTGNNEDLDDDNDGTPDEEDEMPLDYTETDDTDGDGTGNIADVDDDGDGLSDEEEAAAGTDPLNNDTDEDGCLDGEDAFPGDPEECVDWDGDGIGDNADKNDDNDDLRDSEDENDHNIGPSIKISGIPLFPLTGQGLTIDASRSSDEDGEVSAYEWIKDNEVVSAEYFFETSYDETGKKTLEVTVTDDQGESRTQEITIRVYSPMFMVFLGLFIIILLSLAFYIIFKYNPARNQKKTKKTPVKKKSTAKKKTTKKKSKK